ncbi:MAG TPA: HNH endonuclease [Virgibacillus sp.]|nr:HNH endonuclease [Virgibacillus sp.]HLR66910.1 HNH endonuclease [Virgibacillus sp.]
MDENRKIPANSTLFKQFKERHLKQINQFEEFAEQLTRKAGAAKKKSGKASSYARYLIRLLILYYEEYNEYLSNLISFDSVKNIEKITNKHQFRKLNINEGHFYSATFRCYKAFVAETNEHVEEIETNLTNEELDRKNDIVINSSDLIKSPQKKNERNNHNGAYKRNKLEIHASKQRNNWKCEYNKNHTTFINSSNNKPFVEAHHLIPMGAQDYFDNTIDFSDNIVILCPNCHRKIHHGLDEEKKKMITGLFENRKWKYKNVYDIKIELSDLFDFYSIIK